MTVLLTLSVIVRRTLADLRKLAVNDLPAVDYPVIQVELLVSRRRPDDDGQQHRHAAGENNFYRFPGLDIITSNSTQATHRSPCSLFEQKYHRRRD
jgi:hypothetical protein